MKCIIFTRVSTQAQSLESQEDELRNLAIRHGYSIDNQIVIQQKESAISLSADERISINNLKEVIRTHPEVNCLFCWELSRIGRRADVIYNVRDFLLEHHIRWVVGNPYMEVIDTSSSITPAASMMLAIYTSFTEQEMILKKERMSRGKRARIEQGRYVGGPLPWGYVPDKDKAFIIDEKAAEVIRKIFSMYATGDFTFRSLGKELIDMGLLHNERESAMNKINKTLHNRRYCGDDPHFPPIVSKELFEKCMNIQKDRISIQNRPQYHKNTHEMLGKGILRTKEHHLLMSTCPSRGFYMARSQDKQNLTINKCYIDPIIWEISVFLYNKYVNNKEIRQKKLLEEARQLYFKMKKAEEEMSAIQEKIDKLEERMIIGSISTEKSKALSDKLSYEMKQATARRMSFYEAYGSKLEQMRADYWEGDKAMFEMMDFQEKHAIVMQVIDYIYVTRPFPRSYRFILEVHTKFGDEFTKECRGRF